MFKMPTIVLAHVCFSTYIKLQIVIKLFVFVFFGVVVLRRFYCIVAYTCVYLSICLCSNVFSTRLHGLVVMFTSASKMSQVHFNLTMYIHFTFPK